MLNRITFTLISAAIAITVIAFARNEASDSVSGRATNFSFGSNGTLLPSQYTPDWVDRNSFPISIVDPMVLQAGEAIRQAFNAQRTTLCTGMELYSSRGAIQYAKKVVVSNGTVYYTLEIVMGDEAVFARVAWLPKRTSAKFQLIFSIPDPCDEGVQDQLAVSALAVDRINAQNLSWTASLSTEYEGVQIKRFGLGLNPLSEQNKQAFLVSLMASQAPSPMSFSDSLEDLAANSGTTPSPTEALFNTSASAGPHVNISGLPPNVGILTSVGPDLQHKTAAAVRGNGTNATAMPPIDVPLVPIPAAGRQRSARSLAAPAGLAPPTDFDARDTYSGQAPCKAYTVLDQGSCGACFAFSSAVAFSARVCRANPASSVRNVVVSPQSLLNCGAGGCSGGDVLSTLSSLVDSPAAELWCNPYVGAKQACGSGCGASNTYGALAGSVRQVGGVGADGVLQMQLELVRGGPGVVGLTVMSDLFAYSSGVYSPSASAQPVGAHAVALVGWGVDRGVPYWLCQNSWGAGWGEGGFFRILRGADASRIESTIGLVVATPLVKPICPASSCSFLSTTRSDCSCQCPYGRTGPTCKTCALTCRNSAVRRADCSACECRMGFAGVECEGGYRLSSLASSASDAPTPITVRYGFTATVPPPTQTSFVGIYRVGETQPFSYLSSAPVCAATYATYNPAANGGLCPFSGSFQLPRPTMPGQYKVVVVPYSPVNAFGQQGYYSLQDSNIIGLYTVLPAGSSAESRAAAQIANDPGTLLASRLATAVAAGAARQATMKARLDAVQPLRAALLAEKPASLAIAGLGPADPVVWMGTPRRICYSLPPSSNVNPKGLVLYVGTGASGSYYPNSLGPAASGPLPPGPTGCTDFAVSTGVSPGRYTIALEDSATGNPIAAVSFAVDSASVALASFKLAAAALVPTIRWSIPAARASPRDQVRVYSPQGAMVYWFYTSCNCRTAPGPAAVATGTVTFQVKRDPRIQGPYTIKLHPGGKAAAAAVNTDWIPWAKIGW